MSKAFYEWKQIPNGPRLAVATLPESECASFSIYIPAGSRDEAELPAGLAHFVEHMVFKGTKRRSARDLSFEIENAGGQLNACTSEDQTVYEGSGEAELMPLLADIVSDMVWYATFPAAEIELEREVIHEEITMYREAPADHIGDLISKALWGEHPLGNPISGTLESIARIDAAALQKFSQRYHLRSDVVIAAAGPYLLDEVLEMVLPHFPQHFHAEVKRDGFDRDIFPVRNIRENRETDQLQLALAWHTPGRHSPSRFALRMLSTMLGEAASSRLFQELREERGLCYQIGSSVTFFDETGAFEISAGLDPESKEAALECIFREIDSLVRAGPREGELDRAKRLAIAQSKQAFETTSAHAAWVGDGLLEFGEIPCPADWRARVQAVTDEDVRAIAREIFMDQKHAMAEIGAEL